jgi:hypothetical protein
MILIRTDHPYLRVGRHRRRLSVPDPGCHAILLLWLKPLQEDNVVRYRHDVKCLRSGVRLSAPQAHDGVGCRGSTRSCTMWTLLKVVLAVWHARACYYVSRASGMPCDDGIILSPCVVN